MRFRRYASRRCAGALSLTHCIQLARRLPHLSGRNLIGRIQNVFMKFGLELGARVAFLSANRADAWCAGVAAHLSRLAVTWLAHHQHRLEEEALHTI
jgi:hypothetical protein